MCSSSDEIQILQTFLFVVWPEIQHVIESMFETERSSDKDILLVFPIVRSNTSLDFDMISKVRHPRSLDDTIQNLLTIYRGEITPVKTCKLVRHGGQNIQS